MQLIKTVCSENSIKWKFGKISISRVLVDERARLTIYFLGIRIFREPLEKIRFFPNAAKFFKPKIHQINNTEAEPFSFDTSYDSYPESYKPWLRLKAWEIVSNQLNNSYK